MSVSLPNGAIVSIASGYATALVMSVLTNAAAAVGTTTAHTYAIGDFLEVTSGWPGLNAKIVRLSAATTPSITMEGIDTTNTAKYPAGAGIGSVRKITGWTPLSQITNSQSSGGEQQFLDYQFLEGDSMKRIPTVKNSAGMSFDVADDPTLAGYILAAAANDDRLQRAVKIVLPSGGILLYDAYVTLNKTPSLNMNQLMVVPVTISLIAEVVRY